MKKVIRFGILLAAAAAAAVAAGDGWIEMFDGKTLKGWKANENPECWTVENGTLAGHTGKSHLFYMERECVDCEFMAEIKLAPGSNSGMYFRTAFGPGFPKGYESQVNNSHKDPVRTGSLYGKVPVYEQLVADNTWWTQHIIVKGNHITVKVNGKTVVDYVDEKNTYQRGHLALQQHDPNSKVWYRNLKMRELK